MFLLTLTLAMASAQTVAPDDRAMMKRAMEEFLEQQARLGEFTYIERGARKELTSNGAVKAQDSWVKERKRYDGILLTVTVEEDGKPLSAEEKAKTQESIRKIVAERKAMTEERKAKERQDRLAALKKENGWISEMAQALNFKRAGEETLNGRATLVFEAEPNPAYKPSNMQAKVFAKLKGRLWIDKAESQLVKADAEVFENVSIGFGLLGRVDKGTRFHVLRVRMGPRLFLNAEQSMKLSARMLVKGVYQESGRTFTFTGE